MQHVLKLTNDKRSVLEDPGLYGRKLRGRERRRRDSEIVARMSRAPGKLDHASVVAYEAGCFHGDADENYERRSEAENDVYGSDVRAGDVTRACPCSVMRMRRSRSFVVYESSV